MWYDGFYEKSKASNDLAFPLNPLVVIFVKRNYLRHYGITWTVFLYNFIIIPSAFSRFVTCDSHCYSLIAAFSKPMFTDIFRRSRSKIEQKTEIEC